MKKRNTNEISNNRSWADSAFYTAHWVLVALTLTIVFLVFQMQAYTIPTGSMAPTLKGAHFRLRCPQCGYRYDYDFQAERYGLPPTQVPPKDVPIYSRLSPQCPSCSYYLKAGYEKENVGGNIRFREQEFPVIAGDRIFVHKSIYQFKDPKRWDVVVFNNPNEPKINYIKRLIAGPGERLRILDGDIYINGQIQRKPPHVQQELWLPVYDNNYHPVQPNISSFNGHRWSYPFRNTPDSNWEIPEKNPFGLRLESKDIRLHEIAYHPEMGNDFRARHAYDDPAQFPNLPYCSDLMIRFDVMSAQETAALGAKLSKYNNIYRARVEQAGCLSSMKLVLERKSPQGDFELLAHRSCNVKYQNLPVRFFFANVDHTLVLQYGGEMLVYDLGSSPDSLGERVQVTPEVRILGSGTLELDNILISRDLHYTAERPIGGMEFFQAGGGEEFKLGADEFFVCGDNTLASLDSRLWRQPGLANYGKEHRQGIVPRDYLIGKAFVIYWPGPTTPMEKFKLIPYPSGMKVIYGGSNRSFLDAIE